MEELELRVAWARFVAEGADAQQLFGDVLARHREPHRSYHTATHIAWVVRHLLSLDRDEIDLPIAIAAAFFHDAVYDPAATNNETASAELARRSLPEIGWETERTERVAALIEATATHLASDTPTGSDPRDVTTAAFLTADLGVLASDPNDYEDYTRQVRAEYGFLPDREWVAGRRAVLTALLARPEIFDQRLAPPHWEARARGNITAELAALGDQPG